MDWNNLLCKKRFYSFEEIKADKNDDFYRNSFHKDYDRIIFSNSFRRLSKKTQVHPLSKNDHVHNRLTHSLEVASVGRSLGLRAGKFLDEKFPEIEKIARRGRSTEKQQAESVVLYSSRS